MDLVSAIGVVLLIIQASLSIALSMRLRYAILAVDLLPPTIRNIGIGCIGVMLVNSIFNVIIAGENHFVACLSFSLALSLKANETLAKELKRANSLENNLIALKKQATQQQEGYNRLMKDSQDQTTSAELKAARDKIENLKARIRELEVENKHLSEDSASLKKDK
mmetsp:Transcript_7218/g.13262  ORF Transcript_7218/g.13262 Transcript_7218/m.13262 type:complete len:165 (+) Transcript_7218:340-834(+)